MTTITLKLNWTLADAFLSRRQLLCRVLIPAILGTLQLLVVRYALHAWPAEEYAEPSKSKTMTVVVCVAVMAALIWRPIFEMRLLSKMHFLKTFVRQGSELQKFLAGTALSLILALTTAGALAMVAYVVIQTCSFLDLVVISLGCTAGLILSQVASWLFSESLSPSFADLIFARSRRAISLICVLAFVAFSTLIQDARSQWSGMDEDQVIDKIIANVVHPVRNVQRAVRVMAYNDATLLRVRDGMPFPYGWAIYLCLLVPQTFPLYAIVCIFLGFDPLIRSGLKPQKGK